MKRAFAAFVFMVLAIFFLVPLMAGATPDTIVREVALDNQSDTRETIVSVTSHWETLNATYPTEDCNLVKSGPVPTYTDDSSVKDSAGNQPYGLRSYHVGKIQGVETHLINQ